MSYRHYKIDPTYDQYQLDDPYVISANHIEIPTSMPGRVNTDDFLFFKWGPAINPKDYNVLVESADTVGSRYRNIGPLRTEVKLPFVKFDAYSKVGIVPIHDNNKPAFWARLDRANTYNIPDTKEKGVFKMHRIGVLTTACDDYNEYFQI